MVSETTTSTDSDGIGNVEHIDVVSSELIEAFGTLALGKSNEKRFAITGHGKHRHAELHQAEDAKEAGVVDVPISMFLSDDGTVRTEMKLTADGASTTATVNVV
jgi:hypothetical protein